MKSMLSTAPGGPETLELSDVAVPEPGPGQVRIAVRAAGVNYPDTLIIRDLYQMKPPRPFAPGGEVAGIVDAIGSGVQGFAPGDRVLALTGHGGFAEYVCADAASVSKIPADMPFEDAAVFVFTYGTSYHALKDRGYLRPGNSLFVLGASGGVGAAAVELGKAMGARVIAGVSSEDKAAFCRDLGADDTIVYPREMDRDAQKALSDRIKDLVGPKGLDVAYDAVGGDYAEPVLRAMGWDGRFLVVGFPAGIPKIPLNLPLLKSCQIVGVFWGGSVRRDPKAHARNVYELFALYNDGKIRPRITARYPLAQAGEALQAMADRKVTGKVVITPE
ncbi:NADPH:quinone oxidoreductase family protein [Marinibacterium profundimaris]|uniref:NADPH:quinone oxidoreductase n=1 Tax=Marinibacterium profundimaris TaxID=1679460 RepID=A0A225NVE0_9RHOB|nr:NADPH:quinone oxidoreductase family protein [Marinibacterium profundimaris]OWU77298.1 NADPH:quinone oxidoreductase [Marinibacterium profundimaris]